jgi:hypothetical protein
MQENNKPQNQEDVNPSTQQDKIQDILENKLDEPIPNTNGTGSNRPVPREDSLIIKEDSDN